MALMKHVSRTNRIRAVSRRFWLLIGLRPDVEISRLERRLEMIENVIGLSGALLAASDELRQVLQPYQAQGLRLSRVGSEHDGGYVLPLGLLAAARGVISIGIGDNNDADYALASMGLQIHAWDHSVESLPNEHSLISFHRIGVGAVDQQDLLSLQSITRESFGSEDPLVLLMDAEGAEWEAFGSADKDLLDRFSVISVEWHKLGDVLLPANEQFSVLKRLSELFCPVALHANNHATVWSHNGFLLPDTLEMTYVNRRYMGDSWVPGNCPSALLSPCCPDLPEIELPWTDEPPLAGRNVPS